MTRKERQEAAEQRRKIIRDKLDKYLLDAYNSTYDVKWAYKRCSEYAYNEIIKKSPAQELSLVRETVNRKLQEMREKYKI